MVVDAVLAEMNALFGGLPHTIDGLVDAVARTLGEPTSSA